MDTPAPAPGPSPLWERRHPEHDEWWSFDFASPDGALGGFVGLTLWADRRPAWYWAALVGRGRPYLLVRDLEVDPPRSPASREIRSEALWADMNCETPLDHWSIGLEAFGVAMDDPDEALGAELGDRTGLGLDLEWEAAGPPVGVAGAYGQGCGVHGEILVGVGASVETLALDGHGWRRHGWGPREVPAPRWWLGGRLDDGRFWAGEGGHEGPAASGAEGRAAGGAEVHAVLRRAPLRLEGRGRRSVLERRLCRFRPPGPGARPGLGWLELVSPAASGG